MATSGRKYRMNTDNTNNTDNDLDSNTVQEEEETELVTYKELVAETLLAVYASQIYDIRPVIYASIGKIESNDLYRECSR
jgi:hypothetical protein